jgi:hypothetical protein
VDVDRGVEFEALAEVFAECDGVALGFGSGVFAAVAAGASDDAAGDRGRAVIETRGDDSRCRRVEVLGGNPRDDQVLPDGEADLVLFVWERVVCSICMGTCGCYLSGNV